MRTNKRITIGSVKYRVSEMPMDPKIFELYYPAHPNYSPEFFPHVAEGVVVKGREWNV